MATFLETSRAGMQMQVYLPPHPMFFQHSRLSPGLYYAFLAGLPQLLACSAVQSNKGFPILCLKPYKHLLLFILVI